MVNKLNDKISYFKYLNISYINLHLYLIFIPLYKNFHLSNKTIF